MMYLPESIKEENVRLNCTLPELAFLEESKRRRLYLSGVISALDCSDDEYDSSITPVASLVKKIFDFNREDQAVSPENRKPIILYINSPGGELGEGFSLVSAIELSKTPVYTVNIGMWCSMAFLIGITGKRRFTLPSMTFLMHEPSGFSFGKISNMEDKIKFDRKFCDSIIKQLVLKHSCMTEREYDLVVKNELYLLPDDALKYGFVDEIVDDLDTIL